ncbi:hypothetical protein SDC9_93786 [bioreactor metagenome]|uniref:Uncharacterized protein n=1 Tax=bioreactor metagenome TaxID=1076179 RepID=A0A645A2X2_9ZZZZ
MVEHPHHSAGKELGNRIAYQNHGRGTEDAELGSLLDPVVLLCPEVEADKRLHPLVDADDRHEE